MVEEAFRSLGWSTVHSIHGFSLLLMPLERMLSLLQLHLVLFLSQKLGATIVGLIELLLAMEAS